MCNWLHSFGGETAPWRGNGGTLTLVFKVYRCRRHQAMVSNLAMASNLLAGLHSNSDGLHLYPEELPQWGFHPRINPVQS